MRKFLGITFFAITIFLFLIFYAQYRVNWDFYSPVYDRYEENYEDYMYTLLKENKEKCNYIKQENIFEYFNYHKKMSKCLDDKLTNRLATTKENIKDINN